MTDPAPTEGILMALFITVRKVARSRDFYSRVLGGTVVLDENPCMVKLSNSWIIMNPGGPPTPDKPGRTRTDTSSRSASPPACCTASSPPSAPRTSLAELGHRPGNSGQDATIRQPQGGRRRLSRAK
jgi:hypothetical protein